MKSDHFLPFDIVLKDFWASIILDIAHWLVVLGPELFDAKHWDFAFLAQYASDEDILQEEEGGQQCLLVQARYRPGREEVASPSHVIYIVSNN